MRLRELLWVAFFAGLPLSPLATRLLGGSIDLWHSQAIWAQVSVIVLYGYSLSLKRQSPLPANKPIALWFVWSALFFLFSWVKTMVITGKYPLSMLSGVMHLALIFFAYSALTRTGDLGTLNRTLKAIAYTGALIVGYCVLQAFGFDQFLKDLNGKNYIHIVGTIGNPTHLGTHMALLTPIFLYQRGYIWKAIALAAAVLVVLSGSEGAMVSLACGLILLGFLKNWKLGMSALVICGAAMLFLHIRGTLIANFNGRIEAWEGFSRFFNAKPITGMGQGFIMEYSRLNDRGVINPDNLSLMNWRHVHNEYLQVLLEQGVIGLSILAFALINVFRKFYRLKENPIAQTLAAVLLIFCMNSFVNYPAHLWLTGSFALLAYCAAYIMDNEGSVPC